MAVGYIGGTSASSTSANTGLTITKPAGIKVDDLLVCFTAATGSTTVTISGWTLLGTVQRWAGNTRDAAILYRVATSADVAASSYSVQWGISGLVRGAMMVAYAGVDTTNPINASAFNTDSDSSSTSVPASSLVTNYASRVVVSNLSAGGNTSASPTGFISRVSNGTNQIGDVVDRGPDYGAGTLGGWTSTLASAGQHAAWSIALKEDPARREPAWEATIVNATSTSGAASITPSAVSPIQTGDLLIEEIELSSSSATINSVPSGWTLIDSTFSGQCRLYTYQKLYDGSIGSFGFSATVVARAAGSRFTSPHSTTPIDSSAENSGTAGTTVTFPAVTPTGNGLLAYLGASASTASQTNAATTPTNAIERYDTSTASASGSVHTFGGTNGNVSAGVATSTFTSTLTNSADWAAQTIVLANLPSPPAAPTGLTALVTQS